MTGTEIAIVLGVAAFASLVKAITGMGYPLVLIPALGLFLDVADAVILVAPANLALNLGLVRQTGSHARSARTLVPFTGGGVVGAIVGASLLTTLDDRILRVMLVVVIVLFLLSRVRTNPQLPATNARRLAPGVGSVAGFFQGAAGVSGPIVVPWFLAVGLKKDVYVFAITTVFAVTGLTQIVVLAATGDLFAVQFGLSVALVPLALLLVPVGARLRRRIPVEAFERVVLTMLAASAVSLVIRLL